MDNDFNRDTNLSRTIYIHSLNFFEDFLTNSFLIGRTILEQSHLNKMNPLL